MGGGDERGDTQREYWESFSSLEHACLDSTLAAGGTKRGQRCWVVGGRVANMRCKRSRVLSECWEGREQVGGAGKGRRHRQAKGTWEQRETKGPAAGGQLSWRGIPAALASWRRVLAGCGGITRSRHESGGASKARQQQRQRHVRGERVLMSGRHGAGLQRCPPLQDQHRATACALSQAGSGDRKSVV